MGADISVETVAGKLNRVGYDAFIQALRHAKGAGNRNIELSHWMLHLLQRDRTDLALTVDHFHLDRAKLQARRLSPLFALPPRTRTGAWRARCIQATCSCGGIADRRRLSRDGRLGRPFSSLLRREADGRPPLWRATPLEPQSNGRTRRCKLGWPR